MLYFHALLLYFWVVIFFSYVCVNLQHAVVLPVRILSPLSVVFTLVYFLQIKYCLNQNLCLTHWSPYTSFKIMYQQHDKHFEVTFKRSFVNLLYCLNFRLVFSSTKQNFHILYEDNNFFKLSNSFLLSQHINLAVYMCLTCMQFLCMSFYHLLVYFTQLTVQLF